MLILAIDTSTDILGLALLKDQKLIGEYNLSLKRQHSEKLIPLMEEFFLLLDYKIENLDAVAVSIGPGSFTGLRIGITVAKMLGRLFSIPVKGVSTLEVMAADVTADYILPLLDARRERVYYSFFSTNINQQKISLKKLKEPGTVKIKRIPEILTNYKDNNITIIGQKKAETIKVLSENGFKVKQTSLNKDSPRAAVLAELGLNYIQAGEADDIYQIKPAYLKKTQAEINWQQKYGDN